MKDQDSLLSRIQIAKPCSADWESMSGDERERACQLCHLNVYNISTMTENEAESFLRERLPQGRVCVRLFRRADGTVLTDNCPRGLRAARDAARRIQKAAAAAASVIVAIFSAAPSQSQNSPSGKDSTVTPVRMGKVRAIPAGPAAQPTAGVPALRPMQGDVMVPPKSHMGEPQVLMGGAAPILVDKTTYITKVQEKIKKVWQQPQDGKTRITVLFTLGSTGTIDQLKIAASSGDQKLDKEALAAVKKAAPFGQLPPSSQGKFEVNYVF